MSLKIGIVAATKNAIQPALDAFARHASGTETLLFVDEGLLLAVRAAGEVTRPILRRFASLVARAEESGVDGILFSCTVFSPYLEELEPFFSVPLMSVDAAMIAEAAASPGTVGILATVAATEKLAAAQLRERADRAGTALTIRSRLVDRAFDCLPGDPETHDRLIFEAARDLECDRFLLAQMSMARAARLVASLGKPVLTSLESSVKAILAKVSEAGGSEDAIRRDRPPFRPARP